MNLPCVLNRWFCTTHRETGDQFSQYHAETCAKIFKWSWVNCLWISHWYIWGCKMNVESQNMLHFRAGKHEVGVWVGLAYVLLRPQLCFHTRCGKKTKKTLSPASHWPMTRGTIFLILFSSYHWTDKHERKVNMGCRVCGDTLQDSEWTRGRCGQGVSAMSLISLGLCAGPL